MSILLTSFICILGIILDENEVNLQEGVGHIMGILFLYDRIFTSNHDEQKFM